MLAGKRARLVEQLAEIQDSIDFIDAMPLSGAGKVLKTTLRAPFWANQDRKVG